MGEQRHVLGSAPALVEVLEEVEHSGVLKILSLGEEVKITRVGQQFYELDLHTKPLIGALSR